jgi:hypothetical protein
MSRFRSAGAEVVSEFGRNRLVQLAPFVALRAQAELRQTNCQVTISNFGPMKRAAGARWRMQC